MTAKGTTELNKCISVVSRRAYTHIPRQTRWTLCRSAQRRWSLEADLTTEKLKEAATRPIAGPRQAQRLAGLRSGELYCSTQRRRQHEPLRRRRPQLPAEIRRSTPRLPPETRRGARREATHSLSKHHQCTEDPNIPGTRVDAYVETPTKKYPPRGEALYEFRRDAENRSKKPNTQTRHPTGGAHIPPNSISPRQKDR